MNSEINANMIYKEDFTFVEKFLETCQKYIESYYTAKENQKRIENVILDIEHKLRLDDTLTYHDFARLGKLLREVTIERGYCKDIIKMYEPITLWWEDCSKCVKELNKINLSMKDVARFFDARVYSPRTAIGEELFSKDGYARLNVKYTPDKTSKSPFENCNEEDLAKYSEN